MQEQDQTFQKLKHESQILDSSRELPRGRKGARAHGSGVPHGAIVRDEEYRRCLTMRERIGNWFYHTIRCKDAEASYVEELDDVQRRNSVNMNEQLKQLLKNKILKLKIVETSRLQLDSNVIHPFVKVHIVDKNTGCYINKNHQQQQPIIYHNEDITFYEDRKYQSSENNIILPFATNPCDFRKMGNSICKWNQKFFVNFPADKLITPDTVILFQLLDFNHQALLYRDTDSYDKDNFYRIAWAYLRPLGLSKPHFGLSKLQLYRPKFRNKKLQHMGRSFIPSVYYDFLWNNHQKYEGHLTIQLNYTSAPKYKQIEDDSLDPQNLFQEYKLDPTYLKRLEGGEHLEKQIQVNLANPNLLRFYRNGNICQKPNQLVYKFQSQKLGCFRTLFVGNYLFAACSTKKHTIIKVFSLQTGQKVMTLKGHRGIIYSMSSTPNQKYLITSGSDHMVKIWQLPSHYGQYIDEDQSQQLLKCQFVHAAAVYSASSIFINLREMFFILTCCYDGFVRLWVVQLETNKIQVIRQLSIDSGDAVTNKKLYPTSSVVFEDSFFIVGDSNGGLRIYDFVQGDIKLRTFVQNQELRNDEILSIKVVNKNNVLVQANDNIIRHFELMTNRFRLAQKFAGAQFEKQLCNFAFSPDNQYLLSPSESGKPYLWDLRYGNSIPVDHLNLDIKGPLITCDWHPKYNLVAFGGFVQLCPILVYGNILSQAEQKLVSAKMQ